MSVTVWVVFFFFKQKTAYELRISDWSSDVCSSDLGDIVRVDRRCDRIEQERHVVIDDREPHPARARRVARQRLDREPRLARLASFGGRRDERGRFLLLGFAEGVKLGGKCPLGEVTRSSEERRVGKE